MTGDENGTQAGAVRDFSSDDNARRASELAHRALQEAVDALQRAHTSRLTPAQLDELETAVARARQLVASAQAAAASARDRADVARDQHQRNVLIRQDTLARSERTKRGFMALVTWGRRKVTCPACRRDFVVAFRCSTHEPLTVTSVRCARADCGGAVECKVPESAYAFTTRPIEKR